MDSLPIINNKEVIFLFFKVFALVFSFVYLIFSIISLQQTKMMIKTIQVERSWVLIVLGTIQLLLSIFLFIMAIFL